MKPYPRDAARCTEGQEFGADKLDLRAVYRKEIALPVGEGETCQRFEIHSDWAVPEDRVFPRTVVSQAEAAEGIVMELYTTGPDSHRLWGHAARLSVSLTP